MRRRFSINVELDAAMRVWPGSVGRAASSQLKSLLAKHALSVSAGDVALLDGRWYVTHAGLLGLASRRHCRGIHTQVLPAFCDARQSKWAFRAIVFKSLQRKGFVGYGDADPSNV